MSLIRKLILPAVALLMLGLAVWHVVLAQQGPPPPAPPVDPARSPYGKTLAAAGIVEPQSENIAIGSHLPGVVDEVFVAVGQPVKRGDPLFRLDDRQLRAERKYRAAALLAAEAQLAKLEAMPRAEELPPSAAKVRESEANLTDQDELLRRAEKLAPGKVVTEEDLVRRRMAVRMAVEQLERVKAEDVLLKAGAWLPDKVMAQAAVEQARAQLAQTDTELERLCVRAPIDGTVLQKNVRVGEFVGAPPGQALLVLGAVEPLHVRADIAENDVPRFDPRAPARAVLRGHAGHRHELRFVRIEPYVVPKKSLTGDATERVDTRVLQVIYAVEPGRGTLFVGQQVDVFIAAAGGQ
jgi:multidrug resistance efflux pump